MHTVKSSGGTTISFDRYGSGPPLVLVHGAFSDHVTNWQECSHLLAERFTVYAMARRGRGESDATTDHSIEDEMNDVVAVLEAVGEPAFLLGHSYGAVCSLGATMQVSDLVRKLMLYEHPVPGLITPQVVEGLQAFATRSDWDGLVESFMQMLEVPQGEIDEIKTTPFWNVWTTDAPASMNDLRALLGMRFDAKESASLNLPVALMIGTESPREMYATDALAAVLPDARIVELQGQAHEGMTTAPELFAERVTAFLLG